jgi:5-formyltetrahydrofolate cyclo-ligase
MDKKIFRNQIRQKSKLMNSDEIHHQSKLIFQRIEQDSVFLQARVVLAFWSLKDEVFTHDFIVKWSKEKTFALPVMIGDSMEIREFTGVHYLQNQNSFGVLEPINGKLIAWDNIEFALIPGVAFDFNHNRLGRGKGYYDRIMHQISAPKAGLAFDYQWVEHVPVGLHDKSVDFVFTPNGKF